MRIEFYRDREGRERLRVWGSDGCVAWVAAPQYVQALREFFLAERDAELGRWRDPEDPDWVGYRYSGPNSLQLLNERTARTQYWTRNELGSVDVYGDFPTWPIAQRYFATHPKPKPWHEAQEGEGWTVTVEGETKLMTVVEVDGRLVFIDPSISDYWTLDNDAITTARRIWPEVSGDE